MVGWKLELLVRYHTLRFVFIHCVNQLISHTSRVVVLLLGLYAISVMVTQIVLQPT